jgi:hypothetical protein
MVLKDKSEFKTATRGSEMKKYDPVNSNEKREFGAPFVIFVQAFVHVIFFSFIV